MSSLSVQTVESMAALAALGPEWRALEAASGNRLPFCTFEWVESWWRAFPERRAAVEDRLAVRVVRDADGRLVGAAPMMVTARPGRGPVRLRVLQAFGADPNITELRVPLVHPEHEEAVFRALAASVRADARGHDWVQWSGIVQGSAAERVLGEDGRVTWTRDIPNFILPLAPTWEDFRKGLKHNIRESLRKCYNSLKRDNHAFTLEVLERPEDVPGALAHFFRLHGARAAQTDTIRHRDVFDAPASRQFLLEVTERLAARGATRIFVMRVADQVVALRIGYVLSGSLYLYYSGYEPEWGKYSVMTTVVAEALKWAIEHGLATANLSTGNDVSKTRWGPTETVYREATEVAPRIPSRLKRRGFELMLQARQDARVQAWVGRYLARRR